MMTDLGPLAWSIGYLTETLFQISVHTVHTARCMACSWVGVQLPRFAGHGLDARILYFSFVVVVPPFEVDGVKRLSSKVYPPGLRIWNTRSRMTSEDLNASEPRKHDGGNRRIDANFRELGRESNPCNPLAQDPFGGK